MNSKPFFRTFFSLGAIAFIALVLGFAMKPQSGQNKVIDKSRRFDYLVREDMFAGFSGDTAAFERAMKLCEDSLRANPNDAEALVWHGTGVWFLSGQAFQSGDFQRGMALSDSGMSQMDHAVNLDSNSVAVRIPRGAAILASAPYVQEPYGSMLMRKGVADYERVLSIQKSYFSTLPTHSRGELLGAMADTYRRLGETDKARIYFTRITKEIPNSEYATLSASWLKLDNMNSKDIKLKPVTCIGCHIDN